MRVKYTGNGTRTHPYQFKLNGIDYCPVCHGSLVHTESSIRMYASYGALARTHRGCGTAAGWTPEPMVNIYPENTNMRDHRVAITNH